MTISVGLALCLAYLSGVLLSGLAGIGSGGWVPIPWVGWGIAGTLIILVTLAPPTRRLGLRPWQGGWMVAVMGLAILYMGLRSPAPAPQDISHYVARATAIAPSQQVVGRVVGEPHLNRALKGRFELAVEQLQVKDTAGQVTFQVPVRGRVYVTAPLLQVTGLHAGQWMTAQGRLYLPAAAMNPNGFDFQAYLAQRGIFTGLVAEQLRVPKTLAWGLWRVRQRIVRAHLQALGSPAGQLVSAMALGRQAVDLPFDIQDLFARVGLAHTIAASGFHVSLLLGTVLGLVRSRSGQVRLGVGLAVLVIYVTLTGLQASVVRAALMGTAALLGMALERKVNSIGALLTAVTLMLLLNPTWVWTVGFQLSVAATLGLIVTAPRIARGLPGIPSTLATALAVPTAATLWTLPLMLYHFNVISGVSVGLNVIATPLVTVISLGGIASSAVALVSPMLGSLAAEVLSPLVAGLLGLARVSSTLPGSSVAIGQITVWQFWGLYAVLGGTLIPWRHTALKRCLPLVFLGLILMPVGWRLITQQQVTVLAAADELVWIMQDQGRTTLINSGSEKTAFYTVQPFLQQAGINRLDQAIALPFDETYPAGWQSLLASTRGRRVYGDAETAPLPELAAQYAPLPVGQTTHLHHLSLQRLSRDRPILRLQTPQQSWLLLPPLTLDDQERLATAGAILQSQILVWPGDELSETLLSVVQPASAIAYGTVLPKWVEQALQQAGTSVFWTARDGAITWRQQTGLSSYLNTSHRNALPWG